MLIIIYILLKLTFHIHTEQQGRRKINTHFSMITPWSVEGYDLLPFVGRVP